MQARALIIQLAPITPTVRRTRADIDAAFAGAHAELLGAVLDVVSTGLRRRAENTLDALPRMADFARFATACETAHANVGAFGRALEAAQSAALGDALDADAVAGYLLRWLHSRPEALWSGTATDLLAHLRPLALDDPNFPRSPNRLSSALMRAEPLLARVDVQVTRIKSGIRSITVRLLRPQSGSS